MAYNDTGSWQIETSTILICINCMVNLLEQSCTTATERPGNGQELRNVESTFSSFVLGHEGLRLLETGREGLLREICPRTCFDQHCYIGFVMASV